jgi:hypothetical protein
MIRRFSAALIGLALCLPVLAAPVAAHGAIPFVVEFTELADDSLVGTVTNHTTSRRSNVTVTATWENGDNDVVDTAVVQMTNLAPHASSGFLLDPDADVSALGAPTVTATGAVTGTKPAGALQVNAAGFTDDSYTGTIDNEGAAMAPGVTIFAARLNGSVYEEIASDVVGDIAIGGQAAFSIDFDVAGSGTTVVGLIARTVGSPFYTSWNNYFGDLGNTSLGFLDDIEFMAEEGITSGCGDANFCPKSNVTRAQMAVFLARALDLTVDPAPADQGFTDLTGLSDTFVNAINAVAIENITTGCSVTPKKFCPGSAVTRGQMSVFIVKGYDLTPIPSPEDESGPFTDDDGHFSESYNNAMLEAGITAGCGTGLYCPNSKVTREQMAVFIHAAELLPS